MFVLIAFWSLYFSAFDARMQGGEHSIEHTIIQQSKELDSLRTGLRTARQNLDKSSDAGAGAKHLREIKSVILTNAAQIDAFRQRIDAIHSEIAEITAKFEGYKNDYRAFVRANAKGEELGVLRTKSGTSYEKVIVREVSSIGMQILHNDGHARIPYEDLPDYLQLRFQFDPVQKKTALIAETEATRTHESQVAAANALEAVEIADQREKEKKAAREKLRSKISLIQSRISALNSEINTLERSLPGESHKRLSRAPIIREQIAGKRAEVSMLDNEVSRLESLLNQ